MEFAEIKVEDFTSFTPGKVATYIQIERLLNEIGGGGKAGVEFKVAIMNAAGWTYGGLIGYSKNPQMATAAFNKVRLVLDRTRDKDELLALLSE